MPDQPNVPQTGGPHLERRGKPVDAAPGIYDHQGRDEHAPEPPVPEYAPGTNPPGTNPPVEPAEDPARVPIPGSIPAIERGFDQQLGEMPQGPNDRNIPPGAPPQAGTRPPEHAHNPPRGQPKSDDKDKH